MKVYQIYYDTFSKEKLDSNFLPYDNTEGYAKWFEYGVFRTNFLNGNYKSSSHTGFLSWKFQSKTRISAIEFLSFIKSNSGFDVYFINPFQGNTFLFRNVWESGEFYHPGLIQIADFIFKKLNYNLNLEKIINSEEDTLYCNYWVGNEKFWNLFMNFCEPIYEFIENSQDKIFREEILKPLNLETNATYIPYIMERLFSTFLFYKKNEIKSISFQYKATSKYPLLLYPFYRKLENLKKLELNGFEIEKERKNISSYLDIYNQLIFKEISKNIFEKILSRFLYLFLVLRKFILNTIN